jgi:hypothetical protein
MTRFILRQAQAPGEAPRQTVFTYYRDDKLPLDDPAELAALNRGEAVTRKMSNEIWTFVDLLIAYNARQVSA